MQKDQISFDIYDTTTNLWQKVTPNYNNNILNIYVHNMPSFVTLLNYESIEEDVQQDEADILFSQFLQTS